MRIMESKWWPLVIILCAGLGLRLGAAWFYQARLPEDQPFVFGDSESYWYLAKTIASGQSYQFGNPDARIFRTPGYPLVLAPLFLVYGPNPPVLAARMISALFGTLSIAAVYWLGTALFDRRVAIAAATIIAVYPGAIILSVVVLSEAAFAPLLVLQLAFWVAAWKSSDWRIRSATGTVTGLIAAIATLMRPSWLLFTPFAVALGLLCADRKKHLVLSGWILLGLLVGMTPWWVRNARVTGRFVPTTLQVGASLYDGLNPRANGGSQMSFMPDFAAQERQNPSTPGPFEYRLNYRLRNAALSWSAAHPRRVLELVVIKFSRLWNIWPNEPQFRDARIRAVMILTYVPLLLSALFGAWHFRKSGLPVALCWLPAIYLTLLHVVFVSSIRYREPAMLPMAVLASAALTRASPSRE